MPIGALDPEWTVLLVGATDDTLVAARDLGLHILLLQHPTKLTPLQEELADVLHVLDFTDWAVVEPVVVELHRSPGFAVATSQTEPGLENAGRVNDLFGLGGTGYEVAHRLRDKGVMRRHLAATDPAAVAAAPLVHRTDLDAFAARHGYPFVVKPTDGTASFGVRRVDGPEALDDVWAHVERLRGTRTDRATTLFLIQDFLMEEYVEGPELSVESCSWDGRHVVVAITEKFVDPHNFVELGHALPARIDPGTEEQIRTAVGRFLDAIGLVEGVCHTEIRLTPRGPAVIEGHNRPGGDAIAELVQGAYGIDLGRQALARSFGLVPDLPDRPVATAGASTRVVVAGGPGRIGRISGLDVLAARPGVLEARVSARTGAPVRPLVDNWDRLALVAATGADTTAAIARCAALVTQDLHIEVVGPDGAVRPAVVAPLVPGAAERRAAS